MKNPCEQFVEWLEIGSGELPPNLKTHLEQCSHCQQEYALERTYQQVLQSVRSEPLPPMRLQWSQIAEKMNAQKARPRWFWYPLWAPALAIGLMVGFAILIWSPQRPGTEVAQLSSANSSPAPQGEGEPSPLPPDTPVVSDGQVLAQAQPSQSDTVVPFSGTAQPPRSDSSAPSSGKAQPS
ncbi:MAG: hypothetical protein SNJ72_08430, partial [Fimbriimonadales bacterium]